MMMRWWVSAGSLRTGPAFLGVVLAHQAFTKAPVNEPADIKFIELVHWRRHIAEFDRDFPPEERARYVGPFRFRWLSLMHYLRDDPRFAKFSDDLASLGPADCPVGTEAGGPVSFEIWLKSCRERVTRKLLIAIISRGATPGDTSERLQFVDEALQRPIADQEALIDDYLKKSEFEDTLRTRLDTLRSSLDSHQGPAPSQR
jgi:hypothetical protein